MLPRWFTTPVSKVMDPREVISPRSTVSRRGRWYSGRTEVSFVSSRVDITSAASTSWKNRASPFARKINTHPSPRILFSFFLSPSYSPLSRFNLSLEKKRRKNRKFIVALTVNLSRSDIFVRKNLNTLERIHKISRCFERLTPSLRQFLSCVYELRNFWMGRKEGEKERKEGREREREEKRNTIRTARACATRFFPRVSSCGERTVMKRRIIQAWYYLSKLFLQAVCRRTAGIPPWNWKEDYTYRRRSERKKKGEKN